MQKRVVIYLVLFVTILSLSLTFVSANWFSDLFGESGLTGKITQGICGNGVIEPGELCDGEDVLGSINSCEDFGFASGSLSCSSSCLFDTSKCVAKTPTATCSDSDGFNYETKGTTIDFNGNSYVDYCITQIEMIEYYCQNSYTSGSNRISCSNGCVDGACVIKKNNTSYYYPLPFILKDSVDVAIVYGTGAGVSALDIVQAGNLQSDLQSRFNASGDLLVRDSDVARVSNKNLIVIGTAYPEITNSVISQIIGKDYDIIDEKGNEVQLNSGEFVIASYENPWQEGKIALLILGHDISDTVNAATYLRTQPVQTSVGSVFVSKSVVPTCTDSDGGQNYNVKGQASVEDMVFLDSCIGDSAGVYLQEYYCDSNNLITSETYGCQNGCVDGACVTDTTKPKPACKEGDSNTLEIQEGSSGEILGIRVDVTSVDETNLKLSAIIMIANQEFFYLTSDNPSATIAINGQAYTIELISASDTSATIRITCGAKEPPITSCKDSDGGKNYDVKGITTYKNGYGSDICGYDLNPTAYTNRQVLVEGFCDPDFVDILNSEQFSCPNGCSDGACVKRTPAVCKWFKFLPFCKS